MDNFFNCHIVSLRKILPNQFGIKPFPKIIYALRNRLIKEN